jgi:DNA-binding protein H-NS
MTRKKFVRDPNKRPHVPERRLLTTYQQYQIEVLEAHKRKVRAEVREVAQKGAARISEVNQRIREIKNGVHMSAEEITNVE